MNHSNIVKNIQKIMENLHCITLEIKKSDERKEQLLMEHFKKVRLLNNDGKMEIESLQEENNKKNTELDVCVHKGGKIKMVHIPVTKRKDGRFQAYIKSESGKIKYIYAKDILTLKDKFIQAYEEVKQQDEEIGFKTLRSFVEFYKKNLDDVKESTKRVKEQFYKLIEESSFYTKKPEKISLSDLQAFFEGINSNYAKYHTYSLLNGIFAKMLKVGLIKINYCELILIKYEKEKREKPAIDKIDIEAIFKSNKKYEPIYRFLAFTGLRIGELFGLKWSDIDFNNKTIKVERQYNFLMNSVSTPKSSKGKRILPLFDEAEKQLINFEKKKDDAFIFNPKLRANIQNALKKANFHAHGFRSFFCTFCYKAGVDIELIKKWVGHESIDVTMNFYVNYSWSEKDIEKINNFDINNN